MSKSKVHISCDISRHKVLLDIDDCESCWVQAMRLLREAGGEKSDLR